MLKIHLLGASGSGVTSLGKKLSETLGIPVFDCDDYYWKKTDPPFIEATAIADRQGALLVDLNQHESWICSGSMDSWSAPFEELFTHIIFLYVAQDIRAERLRDREKQRWGPRIEPGGDMHVEHEKFIAWAMEYEGGTRNGRSLPKHQAWLARQRAPILSLTGNLKTSETLSRSIEFIKANPLPSWK